MNGLLIYLCLASLLCTQAVVDPTMSSATVAQTLAAGKPIERPLAAGETHAYLITLAASQYVRASIKPQNINLVVTLFAPDGNQISRFASSTPEAEPVSMVTSAAGDFRLEVRAAATGADNGRYEVRLDEVRSATSQDGKAVAARRQAEAERLRKQRTARARQWAIEKYREALALWPADETAQKGAALNNLGEVLLSLGEKDEAFGCFNQALPLLQKAGDPSSEATVLSNLGAIYAALGDTRTARNFYERALALYRDKTVNNLTGQAVALSNMGAAYDAQQNSDLALDYDGQALTLWRQVGNREGEANTLNNFGDIYYWKGNEKRAREVYDSALKLWRAAKNRAGEAATLNRMGKNYYARRKNDEAFKFFTQALPLAREAGDRSNEALALYGLAIVARANKQLEQARQHIEAALVIIDLLRTKTSSPALRASFFDTVRGPYEFYIDLLMEMHKHDPGRQFNMEALRISERARARSLLEMLVEAHADIREGLDPKLLERERACRETLDDKLEDLTLRLRRGNAEQEIDTAKKAVEDALIACQQVDVLIKNQSPRYAALTQPQPLTVQEIQPHLGPDTLLLEYSLGNQRSFLWAVTSTAIASYELPARKPIEEAAGKVYDRMITRTENPEDKPEEEWRTIVARADSELPAAMAALSKMLLAPVASQLQAKRLLIVADGALQRLPFAALPEPDAAARANEALVMNHEIVYLPSASIIEVLRRETATRKPAAKSIAVLADPVFEANDPRFKTLAAQPATAANQRAASSINQRILKTVQKAATEIRPGWQIDRLPFTGSEAQKIVALASATDSKLALAFDASRATAESQELSQYRIVHFATHGLMDPIHPELSGVVLSMINQNHELQDGFLRAHEVFNLKLPAELIVLSACQTGLGPLLRGEGMISLTRGFMYAGAPRVVVSLWSVNDAATAALMERFYKKMLVDKMRPAEALRAAQIEMLKQTERSEWKTPYFWAPFVLQGEWR